MHVCFSKQAKHEVTTLLLSPFAGIVYKRCMLISIDNYRSLTDIKSLIRTMENTLDFLDVLVDPRQSHESTADMSLKLHVSIFTCIKNCSKVGCKTTEF